MDPREFISWARPDLWGREKEYVADAVESTWLSGGPYVERLEREFAACVGSKHVFAVANGTAALHLAYLALGIAPGDEIIVPGFAFMAAANVALHLGARPVFAEVDPDTWCMRAEDVERQITSRTRLIVAVHTYGNVCLMDPILDLAARNGIAVLEDAAESFPSRYRGRVAGTMSSLGTFSFQATKTIATGEGGMVVTDDERFVEKLTLYRSHGMKRKDRYYWHDVPGLNFRLANPLAAIGCAQLEQLPKIMSERRRVFDSYRRQLGEIAGVTLQKIPEEVEMVLWATGVRLEEKAFPQGRDAVMGQFREAGIETRPGFYAASQLEIFDTGRLPVCEAIAGSVIALPTYPTLREEEIVRICRQLARCRR